MNKQVLTALALILLLPISTFAADPGSIELRSAAEVEMKTSNEKGETEIKRVNAEKAEVYPGDEVIFTTHYRHVGEKPADNVVITNPVPKHMTYVGKSAKGKDGLIRFSIDGGEKYDIPSRLKVKTADGGERVADPAEYTHVRWIFSADLKKGDAGHVSFRAKLK
ncbi:MAG: hypothetical protein OEV42_04030 [Deltaproteobacteria bacterium]|nr:hypothetical protein [Deltaproteobacteria bacterium]